ncbi:MAG: hypothetical protein ABI790_10510 [Betaproteobacteria bacterium]
MAAVHVHQIYYSAETRSRLDPGFIPLDNLANDRPDWREYWPIRRHLLQHPPQGDDFIGFFSPKFGEKTGLDSSAVAEFVSRQPADTDVILFSPFFDQIAAYWNIFEHGMNHHPGIFKTFKMAADMLVPGVSLETLATDSRNTVFSNYFVARPAFWKEWLAKNEVLFAIAEAGESDLAARLNGLVKYAEQELPAKVFMMERVATLLLATNPAWRVQVRDPMLGRLDPLFQQYRLELICMDALKIAFNARPAEEYRTAYRFLRNQIVERSKAKYEASQQAAAGGRKPAN